VIKPLNKRYPQSKYCKVGQPQKITFLSVVGFNCIEKQLETLGRISSIDFFEHMIHMIHYGYTAVTQFSPPKSACLSSCAPPVMGKGGASPHMPCAWKIQEYGDLWCNANATFSRISAL